VFSSLPNQVTLSSTKENGKMASSVSRKSNGGFNFGKFWKKHSQDILPPIIGLSSAFGSLSLCFGVLGVSHPFLPKRKSNQPMCNRLPPTLSNFNKKLPNFASITE
jgi:hypothetical protein